MSATGTALGAGSCGAGMGAAASRSNVPDRCAAMTCPYGSHCEAYGNGGAHCEPDSQSQRHFP